MDKLIFSIEERNILPTSPGVYYFYNKNNNMIYVGKAKNIRKRVGQYFQTEQFLNFKTTKMVENIQYISCTVVSDERDSLLLEKNLISQNKPFYNISLKDNKSYPYLCITSERYPRLITTRQRNTILGQYFGPFTNIESLNQIKSIIRNIYPLRTCKLNLSKENIEKKIFKRCLEFHIGKCLAPCEGLQKEDLYMDDVKSIVFLLKGNFSPIKKKIKQKMLTAAKEKKFNIAQNYKDQLEALVEYKNRSIITNPRWGIIDVIALLESEEDVYISYLHIYEGIMLIAETLLIKKKLDESISQIGLIAIGHYREKTANKAKELISNIDIESLPEGVKLRIPKSGDKKKLLEMAIKNAYLFKKKNLNKKENSTKTQSNILLQQVKKDLRLKDLPIHIECFDNSNLDGNNPVAAMVCFLAGKPAKKHYRHYHIKSVIGINDCASMSEVVSRRYANLLRNELPLPNLILVDGGKGQLNATIKALDELKLYGKIAVIAIAKRLEELYYPKDPIPLHLPLKSPTLKLLQHIRNEAHRFAITFHRGKRLKDGFTSRLLIIPGVGSKTISRLFIHFKTIYRIEKATLRELSNIVGPSKGNLIFSFFKQL